MSDLHDRAARALGWNPADVRSVSMQSLRDLVRAVNPALADEISLAIQSGAYVRGESRRKGRGHATKGSILDAIHAGCRVTIVDRFGKQRTGRAVMRGPYGWVLNMGGRHGTPAVASDDNIVAVKC